MFLESKVLLWLNKWLNYRTLRNGVYFVLLKTEKQYFRTTYSYEINRKWKQLHEFEISSRAEYTHAHTQLVRKVNYFLPKLGIELYQYSPFFKKKDGNYSCFSLQRLLSVGSPVWRLPPPSTVNSLFTKELNSCTARLTLICLEPSSC